MTYGELVLLGQLVHTQDSNDILERLVVLKDLLDSGGDLVVLLTDLDTSSFSAYIAFTNTSLLTIRGSSIRDLESRGSTAG